MSRSPFRKRRRSSVRPTSITSISIATEDLKFVQDMAKARVVTQAQVWEDAIGLYREAVENAEAELEEEEAAKAAAPGDEPADL
jgi:hypothetical protein